MIFVVMTEERINTRNMQKNVDMPESYCYDNGRYQVP